MKFAIIITIVVIKFHSTTKIDKNLVLMNRVNNK